MAPPNPHTHGADWPPADFEPPTELVAQLEGEPDEPGEDGE